MNSQPSPILIAHSFGGAVGMEAASRTDSFGGLVMIDTPVNLDREMLKEMKARAPKARNEHLGYASLEEGLSRFRLSPEQECRNDFIGDHIARCALVTPAMVAKSLAIFPAGTPVVAIPDAAHHVMIDQPLALVSSLRTLLSCWPLRGAS